MQALDKKNYSILVVDDEPDIVEVLTEVLGFEGYQTKKANNISAAYSIIQNEKVDLILSDIRMPNGTGVDLLKKVRLERSKQMPFILMTGQSDVTAREAIGLGASAYLEKPLNYRVMSSLVYEKLHEGFKKFEVRPSRIVAEFPIEYSKIGSPEAQLLKTNTRNIGRGGFFMADSPELLVDDQIDFSILVPNRPIKGIATIRWRNAPEIDEKGVGLEFSSLNATSQNALDELLKELQKNAKI